MCTRRALHTCTAVGKSLFFLGGVHCSSSQVDVYDTVSNSWTSILTSNHGVLPDILHSHTSVRFGECIYVFGGCDGTTGCPLTNLWRLHIPSMTWEQNETTSPDRPAPRRNHTACLMGEDPRMIVFGGRSRTGEVLDDLWHLHLESGVWTRISTHLNSEVPLPRGLGRLDDGGVVRGDFVEMRRASHTAVWDPKAKTMIVFAGTHQTVSNTVFVFSFEITQMRGIISIVSLVPCSGFIPTSRANHTCVIHNQRLHIVGGREVDATGADWDPSPVIYETYVRLLVRDSNWVRVQPFGHHPTPRWGHSSVVIGDHMYLFGGFNVKQAVVNDMYKVRLVAMTSDVMSDMRSGVLQSTAVAPMPRSEVLRMLSDEARAEGRPQEMAGEKRQSAML